MTEGTTVYCGDNCNHTGPHNYPPTERPLRFIRSTPCVGMRRHRWCNHPGHNHCVVCDQLRHDYD